MRRTVLGRAMLLVLMGFLFIGGCPPETPESDVGTEGNAADEASQSCENFDDPMACEDAVEGCQATSEPEECTDAVYDCTETSEPQECTEQVYDCTQTSDPEGCTEQVYDCLQSEDPMECPDATVGVLDQIGLNIDEHLRGRASFEPGPRCSGSDFMSSIRMSNLPPLVLIQDQGSFEQRTEGRALSDGMTLVLVDRQPNYDEMYILQANSRGDLQGVSVHDVEGSLPNFGDIPRLDPMLTGVAHDAIFGVRGDRRALFDVLGADSSVCDYSVMIDIR